ncbi:hypothetical protein [Streptomyces sp. NPDC053720]|uniref:hypothetical protein n=1 Tax=Streptomyces sp. NPDC053720 TaxID=3154855 RepID=UPI003419D893
MSAGTVRDRQGAHVLDTEVWAGPCCARLPEGPAVEILADPIQADAAYRVLLGHTTACAACRAGATCAPAARLRRAWREARR